MPQNGTDLQPGYFDRGIIASGKGNYDSAIADFSEANPLGRRDSDRRLLEIASCVETVLRV
jgi:hypothetical protein